MKVSCCISAHVPVFAICGLVGRFSCGCRRGVGSGVETFPCTIKATHLSSETTENISPVGKIFLPYWECAFRMLSCHMAKVHQPRELSLAGTALGHQIAHHAAHFLPAAVGIHEFCATYVRPPVQEIAWARATGACLLTFARAKAARIPCHDPDLAWLEGLVY